MSPFEIVSLFDLVAFGLWLGLWLGYEWFMPHLVGARGALNKHMIQIRYMWMLQLSHRTNRIADGQFIGHTLNSATFFGSANLIVMTAIIGVIFSGDTAYQSVADLKFLTPGSHFLFEFKLLLVVVSLSRGLLDFIWSIRQMNYCLAAIGAMPDSQPDEDRKAWGLAIGTLINPAMSTFSRGVRGYYFSLAAAAWLIGPLAFAVATAGSLWLLVWRQSRSGAADGVREVWSLAKKNENLPR